MINIIGNRIGAQKSGGAANLAFEFTVDTTQTGTSAADQFTIPITSATPYDISTSDGHSITGATGATTLTFSAPGTYTVKITDSCEGWRFNNTGDKLKLLDISNWGVYANTATNSFYGASNMTCSAVDKPTGVHTTLNGAFGRCTLFNGAIGNWDVSTVTNMAFMFDHLFSADGEFNQDISSWDVSNVTTFQRMFTNSKFNQDISSWTIKNAGAVNMNYMFSASSFNQPLNDWDMTAVADMSFMFNDNRVFNQDLNLWNTNGCANMASMFRLNPVFNGDISTWNTSNVTNMSEMFNSCNFNGDISAWNTSNVTNMFAMFRFCPMNSNISGWNVSNVTNMALMFVGAPNFNQPIGSWNVSSVTDFDSTFVNATSFNQDLSAWTFSPSLTNLNYTFQNATSFNNGGQPLTWNISNFTAMNSTFYGASSFNADISSWAGNTISNWNQTFRLSGLNQNINSIITSSATNLSSTFRDASLFNNAGVALNLNTSNVTNMQYMFGTAALVNQISGLDSFEVENVTVGDGFIQSSRALTTANYDALLVSWESKLQALYPGGVGYVNTPTFAFGLSTYTLGSAAETARTSLINTYGWTITDGGGVLTNESYLVASYNFDVDFTDYTGTHNATLGAAAVTAGFAGGVVSNCADFDGVNGFLSVLNSADFSMTDGVNDVPYSISFWVKFDTTIIDQWFINKWAGIGQREWIVALNSSGNLAWIISDGSGSNYIRSDYAWSPTLSTWYHLVFTYDGSTLDTGLKTYINGSIVSAAQSTVGTYTGTVNTGFNTIIGEDPSTTSANLDGQMDELHLWKGRELTAAKVLDIYNTENAGNTIFPPDYTTHLVASYNFDSNFTDYTGVNN
jgi:surface protein